MMKHHSEAWPGLSNLSKPEPVTPPELPDCVFIGRREMRRIEFRKMKDDRVSVSIFYDGIDEHLVYLVLPVTTAWDVYKQLGEILGLKSGSEVDQANVSVGRSPGHA